MVIYPCPHCGGLHRTPYVSAYICSFTKCLKSGNDIVIKGNRSIACGICHKRLECLSMPVVGYKNLMAS